MDAKTGWLAPAIPKHHPDGPPTTVQKIFDGDAIPPAATLRETSNFVPEVKPLALSRYTSRAFHDLEVEHMWGRVWQFAAWTFDIPNAGDSTVYDIAGRSAVIVRQADGSLKAFENSCPHRGRKLCTENAAIKQIRCPYHAFTWDIDGTSRWIPAAWDFPQLERETLSLREVQVDVWNGFIFVNFDPNAKPLASYLGKLVDQWKDWDFTKTRFRAVTAGKACNANWKAVLDAFIETLHVTGTHPEAAYLTSDTSTQYDVWPDEPHFSRFHSPVGLASANLLNEPSEQETLDMFTSMYLPEAYGTEAGELQEGETARAAVGRLSREVYKERMGVDATKLPNSEVIDGTEYMVFPNMIVWPSFSNPLVYRFRPGKDHETSYWEISLFIPFEGERPPSGEVYHLKDGDKLADVPYFGGLGAILDQDVENLQYMQEGMNANSSGVAYTARYQEQRIRHYHNTLDRYLDGTI